MFFTCGWPLLIWENKQYMHAQLCLTLFDPMDCSPPGSSVHGILQARILEWVAFPPPGNLPNSGIKPVSSALVGGFFTTEPLGKPQIVYNLCQRGYFWILSIEGNIHQIVLALAVQQGWGWGKGSTKGSVNGKETSRVITIWDDVSVPSLGEL